MIFIKLIERIDVTAKQIIEKLLKKYNCSNYELSGATGISEAVFSKILNNKTIKFQKITLFKIAKFLNLDVEKNESTIFLKLKIEEELKD